MNTTLRKSSLHVEEMRQYILAGKTIKELQDIYGRSRTTIMDFKKQNGLVGITPNSRKIDRESGVRACSGCGRDLPLTEYHSNGAYKGVRKYKPKCNQCSNTASRDNFYARVLGWLESEGKSYECGECGVTGPIGFLDFHHIDPSQKEFTIGGIPKSTSESTFEKKIIPELKKCLLLCPSCHRLKHLTG